MKIEYLWSRFAPTINLLNIENLIFLEVALAAQALAPRVAPSFLYLIFCNRIAVGEP
jgi:hypothetical protein